MASGPNTEKLIATFQEKAKKAAKDKIEVDECQKGFEVKDSEAVSYTHLTLPTIYSV